MYVLMNHILDNHDIKNRYIQVEDEFLTVIKWTFDITKAKIFDTDLAAELFVANNKEYINRNFDADNIFVGKLVPEIKYFLGNFGKNKVG